MPILEATPQFLFKFGCTCVDKGLPLGFVSNVFNCIDDPAKTRHSAYENAAWRTLHIIVTKIQYIYDNATRLPHISAASILEHPEMHPYRQYVSTQQVNGKQFILTFLLEEFHCLNCTSYVRLFMFISMFLHVCFDFLYVCIGF
tara:strand:- start:806 stop:1237 length:432 start_codon:yes stop_codon:yes gene_type:complete